VTQNLLVKVAGLYTFPSDLSAVPEGALSQADNIVIDRDGMAEPRRGFDYLKHGSDVKSSFSDPSYRANKLFFYQNKILAHHSTDLLAYHDSTTGWMLYSGSYNPPTASVPMRSVQANQNFYFTTSLGVYKLDAYNATPGKIGVPAALDTKATVASAPPATWLSKSNTAAYRIVWGIKDANNNLIFGAPSQREVLTNTTAATIAVQLRFTVPADITTAHFFQVYRSAATNSTSGYVEPSDELGLVYEGNPNSSDLSNGYVTVVDVTPDALRGATIYTAQSQEGLGNSNEPPPMAHDLAVFPELALLREHDRPSELHGHAFGRRKSKRPPGERHRDDWGRDLYREERGEHHQRRVSHRSHFLACDHRDDEHQYVADLGRQCDRHPGRD
jgi:hypothetical protein